MTCHSSFSAYWCPLLICRFSRYIFNLIVLGFSFSCEYWAIQAGLLTPLTFARHRLSPLAAFTSGAYFLHNGRRWQWIFEFYTANVKGIFLRHVVIMCLEISNNLLLVLWDAPKRIFSTNSRSSDQPQNDADTFHGNFCNYNSVGICTASPF